MWEAYWKALRVIMVVGFLLCIPLLLLVPRKGPTVYARIIGHDGSNWATAVQNERSIQVLKEFSAGKFLPSDRPEEADMLNQDSILRRKGEKVKIVEYLEDSAVVNIRVKEPISEGYLYDLWVMRDCLEIEK